jgi:4-hydroxy-2-oxoheptanedioate aldolase
VADVAESLSTAVTSGAPLVGTVLTMAGASTCEFLAEPFDIVWVDLEHAALGALDAQEMVIGAQAAGAFALARLPSDAHHLLTVMLDAGVDGIVLADVRSARTASSALERTGYPPRGRRGWGPRRLALRGRSSGGQQVDPSIWVQLESAEGIEQAAEILRVPGVDAAVVGAADLSRSLCVPFDGDALRDAIASARDACTGAGVAFGVAGPLDALPSELYAGASIMVHSTDARLCARAVDQAAAWMRGVLETKAERVSV